MIYLAHCLNSQTLFALYGEVLLKYVDPALANRIVRALRTRSRPMNSVDRLHAHYLPECREINWSLKLFYTAQDWDNLLRLGVVID